jgi:hypothetical protein
MHLDFANALNLVSTVTLIGALIFTGLQVRAANRARREQAAVTVIETAALSENSARFLELLSEIPEGASATVIDSLDAETRRQIFLFGLRVEVIGYMVLYFSHCDGILTASSWGKIERTMSDLIAYPGIQQWWEERRHWHTEEFGRVVDAIIAKGAEPKAYSTYDLRAIAAPQTRS